MTVVLTSSAYVFVFVLLNWLTLRRIPRTSDWIIQCYTLGKNNTREVEELLLLLFVIL